MAKRRAVRSFSVHRSLIATALVALAAGCASAPNQSAGGKNPDYRAAIGAYSNPAADIAAMDPIAAAAFWGTRYNRDQGDPDVAAHYSAALRKIGSIDEALNVIMRSATLHPKHPAVNIETGKALIDANRAFEAVRYLETAVAVDDKNNWRALSALGVAFDQIGEHEAARQQYNLALSKAPNTPSILNNKALSYALSGELKNAELTLREAATKPGANAQVRQNLALVLALKGDMRAAERLSRSDLPPQVADKNIAFYRSLVTQPAYWSEFKPDDIDAPLFDKAPKIDDKPIERKPLPKLREQRKEPKQPQTDRPIASKKAGEVTPTAAQSLEPAPVDAKSAQEKDAPEATGAPVSLAPALKE